MSSVFKSPKMPAPPPPPPPSPEAIAEKPTPTRDDAILMEQQTEKTLKRKGKASTILTGTKTRTETGGSLKEVLGQ
jgi:hypothetical protein